jgi:hypothetical protein
MAALDAEPALASPAPVHARLAAAERLVADIRARLDELSGVLSDLRADLG